MPVNVSALPGDGSYEYHIHQETGSIPGLTYDQSTATLTITLTTDAAQLHRAAKTQWTDSKGSKIDTAVFTNTYRARPATVSITAVKHLDGRGLKAGEFSFRLWDKDKGKLDEASNDAQGKIAFKPLILDRAGEYTYSVNEVQGSLPGIAYDTNEAKITVHVTDDQQGQLQAAIDGNNPTFTNTYRARPDKPDKPDNPDDPGNSGKHNKLNQPVEPSKPGESNNAPNKTDQTSSNSQKPAPGNQSSSDQAKSSTNSQALAASGADIVMPVALTVGTAVLDMALMCLLRHRRDQDTDLG
ncbi:hypothetical protein DKK68_01120 [Bifidobacterium asteroides]|uniref:Spy0128 family protein n=1 Tax=Bifidobacterium asteroides TaxID=1684 RepID=UPI000D787DDE|nr:FctA domain-containing protein [Bifidobacterium asteroides]PXY88797.1 hypothetical protein DKK68_01120 [Bifidobacterium asteroides]